MAAYCRVSTDSEEQTSSLENQLIHYREYINNNQQYELVNVYADEGISGTNTKKREQFNKMIQDCKGGKIDLIITKSISRFARNTLDCLQYVRALKQIGVEVFFEKENIYTLDSKGEVLLTVLTSLAQDEIRSISENTTWGVRRRFEQGRVIVNEKKCLGYDRVKDGNLIINTERAKIVKRIYTEYLNGKGPTRIAKELERDKVKGATGATRWHASTIEKMIRNEKYKGDALLQKTYTVDFLTKKRVKNDEGKVNQYYVEESHPPIIDKEMWQAVQLEIERRKQYIEEHKLQKYDYGLKETAFVGKVICGECGRGFRRKLWHSNTKRVRVWQCGGRYQEKGKVGCTNIHIYEEKLHEIFIGAFNSFIENKEGFINKWQAELQCADDVLKGYRLRQFIGMVTKTDKIVKIDKDLVFKVLDKITIMDKEKVVVKFLDGTELECEMEI